MALNISLNCDDVHGFFVQFSGNIKPQIDGFLSQQKTQRMAGFF